MKQLIVTTIAFIIAFTARAQQASITADRNKILFGEQLTLQLKVANLPAEITLTKWFDTTQLNQQLVIANKSIIDTIVINDVTTYQQTIQITGFDSGQFTIPPMDVVTNTGNRIGTAAITIEVLPPNIAGMQGLRAMKEIAEAPATPPTFSWRSVLIGLVVVTILSVLFWYLIQRIHKQPATTTAVPYGKKNIVEALVQLGTEQPSTAAAWYTWMNNADRLVRTYLLYSTGIPALQCTADELIIWTNEFIITDEAIRTQYHQLLRLSNAVLYAQHQPNATAASIAAQYIQIVHAITQSHTHAV
ncbi:MAG: BatD family protein [Chitinophagaceae bacterium]